jgi:K+-transporting ATPase ATPase C chain
MKKELLPALLLTIVCIVFFSGIYTVVVWGIAQLSPNKGDGFVVTANGKTYYENVAQKFTDDKYFMTRPSAVDYNAAGSGGSNKGPNNPDYLADVQKRIDTFMVHNPGVKKSDIPSDLVTASGSGLDPDISIQGAKVQVARIAKVRGLPEDAVNKLVDEHVDKPLFGVFGPEKINVLKLNIALEGLAVK